MQPDEARLEVALQARLPSLAPPIALGTDHLDDPAPAGDQLRQPLRPGVGERPRLRPMRSRPKRRS